MGNEGRGTIFRRKDSKYLLYLPVSVADDSMFPFKCDNSIRVRVSFKPGDDKLIIEKWKETESPKAQKLFRHALSQAATS